MKLLLDHNISPRLTGKLGDVFGSVVHVDQLGMREDTDTRIWDYAKERGYTIVTKDKDFYQRSALLGAPPKIIHLTLGNCSVDDTATALLERKGHVIDFLEQARGRRLPSKSQTSQSLDIRFPRLTA